MMGEASWKVCTESENEINETSSNNHGSEDIFGSNLADLTQDFDDDFVLTSWRAHEAESRNLASVIENKLFLDNSLRRVYEGISPWAWIDALYFAWWSVWSKW